MENDSPFLNLGGTALIELGKVAVNFGVQYLYAKKEKLCDRLRFRLALLILFLALNFKCI